MQIHDDKSLVGFPVSNKARDHYQFAQQLFASSGKTSIADFHAARLFAQHMNQKRDLVAYPEQAVQAGQVNAMALIHGITQYIFRLYCEQHGGQVFPTAFEGLHKRFDPPQVNETLGSVIDEFPPMTVYLHQVDRAKYLSGASAARPHRDLTLEEMLMLWLSNANPAFVPFLELFNDEILEQKTLYPMIIGELHQYFGTMAEADAVQKQSFTNGQNIIDFLLMPARAAPHSLEAQLVYIMEHWGGLISAYMHRLLRGLDLIKEETKPFFGGTGPALVPTYEYEQYESDRFSPDRDWMPNVVLLAKNTYVWLDQLSKKYDRPITRLDQIPDAELDNLARWGFTGIWLIGLWERSTASQRVKQLCGNPEAVASAYSLFEYRIAADLGGEAACDDLKQRAWRRGIRVASDMVPNHVGIDGQWVIEHPDWFVGLDYSPFPGYTFNGPDLSHDERVGIFLEDHYYNRSDAAVVFKRVDRWTGSVRYLYHGNDGTSMPWNDTAQLNYLHAEMREAMIQTILHVARQFPIIRFDAAMTLAKKHIQRLWFPEPGSGGDIPSRAEHGLSRAQFDALMPEEFWREVVDRVAREVPDTLLLAEAFWMMEGYFVRTLGMHRVYNSAFMNMLRDEDNGKYRLVIKNTQEFDPEVLKRYVNFMNNPDERTAVDQFGKEDKYFGVCTVMSTMPGLPMFGHGQIEGFTEKYGMEYRRAYWDEQVDTHLVRRHEREIFPLLRKRYLFAGVDNFLLYDFFAPEGFVHEDVFAYSNAVGGEHALVVYHNRYAAVRGTIRLSAAYLNKADNPDERTLMRRTVGEGLGLTPDANQYCIFLDHRAGLEYIRNCKELCDQGLYVELGAYQCHVFLDFQVVDDVGGQYRHLAETLGGRGVPSVREALQEIYVRPVREPFQALVNAGMFQRLLDARITEPGQVLDEKLLGEVEQKLGVLFQAIEDFLKTPDAELPARKRQQPTALARKVRQRLETILHLSRPDHPLRTAAEPANRLLNTVQSGLTQNPAMWGGLLGWLFVHALGDSTGNADGPEQSRSWIDEWLLGKSIYHTLQQLEIDDQTAAQTVWAVKLATTHQHLLEAHVDEHASTILETLLQDTEVQHFLGVNRYQNILWFNKEAFESLLFWLLVFGAIPAVNFAQAGNLAAITARYNVVQQLQRAGNASGFQIEKLRANLAKANQPVSKRKKLRGKS